MEYGTRNTEHVEYGTEEMEEHGTWSLNWNMERGTWNNDHALKQCAKIKIETLF